MTAAIKKQMQHMRIWTEMNNLEIEFGEERARRQKANPK